MICKNLFFSVVVLPLSIGALTVLGCSSSQTKPLYTPEAQKELHDKEIAAEMPEIMEMERQYGPDNPQVKQRKMELGLLPDQSAAGEKP